MNVQHIKSYLTPEECEILNAATIQGITEGWMQQGYTQNNTKTDLRLTSRASIDKCNYPNLVLDIDKKIAEDFALINSEIMYHEGQFGIITTHMKPGSFVWKHTETSPDLTEDQEILRFVINTQSSDTGGILKIDDIEYPMEQGDLVAFLVSKHAYEITNVTGNTPKISWWFGRIVDKYFWI